jgi:hypothetical protein
VTDRRLSELLRDAPVPDEREAQERGWRVVQAAFESRHPLAARPRINRLAVALVIGLLVAALALSPAGAKVADLVGDVVKPGQENARPALTSLPAPGQLLVTSAKGPWVVDEDGSKRLLGAYEDAAWSPHGLYLAATRGRQLTAVDPVGSVRWSLAAAHPVSHPAWSTSGVRIAYLSGSSLRVAAGDGTGDRLLARGVAPVTPSWRPQREPLPAGQVATGPGANLLAYVDRRGRVLIHDADSGERLIRNPPGPPPSLLAWSSDGRRLLAASGGTLSTFDAGNSYRHPTVVEAPRPWAVTDASFEPGSHRVAAVETSAAATDPLTGISKSGRPTGSAVLLGRPDGRGFFSRRVFAGPGRLGDLAWSPDASSLLVGWRDADQWLFLDPSGDRVRAVGHISRQFDPGAGGRPSFPGVDGWCCAP